MLDHRIRRKSLAITCLDDDLCPDLILGELDIWIGKFLPDPPWHGGGIVGVIVVDLPQALIGVIGGPVGDLDHREVSQPLEML